MNKTYAKTIGKRFTGLLVALALLLCVAPVALAQEDATPLKVAALNGPTGIGMVGLMDNPDYEVELVGAPDQVVAMLSSGQVDIAAVPTNLAATLYNRLNGGVQLLALNTLGVLYILDEGDEINSVQDLAGRELLATGQGAMPEYILNYILKQAGIADQVEVLYKSEHSELATLAAAGQAPLVMLPEPHVTTVLSQNPEMRIAIDLTEAFAEAQAAAGDEDAVLSMGVMIVRREVAEQRPEEIQAFLDAYGESVAFVNGNVEEAAEKVAEYGILGSAAVAAQAIPNCNIVLIDGPDMRAQIEPLFTLLYEANPDSVGGALPGDDFYYVAP